MISKSRLDKAGRILSNEGDISEEMIELEDDFDKYRAAHLAPLSNTTLELQKWLQNCGGTYYIAQRLKRKPQILRKLRRLSVRLSQLQDIGGSRIIVDRNSDVDKLVNFIKQEMEKDSTFSLKRFVDYRERGRDITGYRGTHLIIECNKYNIELQIRSRIQHYWAESIERSSVVYGYHLKEQEGDPSVIKYFKTLSDIFYEIESGRNPSSREKIDLEQQRETAQEIIYNVDHNRVFDSYVNEDVVRTLQSAQGKGDSLNNWIIVFDWNKGVFITWDEVGRNIEQANSKYIEYERQFSASNGFEVVMIGSSDVSTVRQTHSHYFGIQKFDNILENLDQSIAGLKSRMDIDVGARQILSTLKRKKYWGRNSVSLATLKNHFSQNIVSVDASLHTLRNLGLVNMDTSNGPVSLNIKKKSDIEAYL